MVVYWSNHLKGSLFDPFKVVYWSNHLKGSSFDPFKVGYWSNHLKGSLFDPFKVGYWSNHLIGSLFDPFKVVYWSPDLPRPGQRSCVFSPAFVQSNGQSHRRCFDRCLLLRLHAAAVLFFAGRPLTTRCLTVAAPRKCCSVTSPPCVALLALPFTDRPLFLRCLPMTYFTVQVMKWTRSRETSSPSHARR